MTTYGQRLKLAMDHLSGVLQRKITRIEVAEKAGCSRQNIGMILTGSQREDQHLKGESHIRVAAYLRVDSHWLSTGEGDMLKGVPPDQPQPSYEAKQLDIVLKAIPEERRLMAYHAATQLLISYLAPSTAPQLVPEPNESPNESAPVAKPSASHLQ